MPRVQLPTQSKKELAGPEKAAIFMLAIGDDHAARLFRLLDLDEVKELSQTMAVLGKVDSAVVEQVMGEFGEAFAATGGVFGGYEITEKLLRKVLDPETVELIMQEIRGPAGRTVWEKLGNVHETVLASYLRNEYPQTVAVILSRIDPAHAARVLSHFPDKFAIEVILRMIDMDVVQKDIISDIEETLRTEFITNLSRSIQKDNFEIVVEIFNKLDSSTEARFMALLEERNREAAERVRSLMFTFEDLRRLDASGIQTLIRNAGNDRLALALKGASEELRKLFFDNMSERAARILREEMASMGPVRLRDVEEAQQYLVNLAKQLAANGEIVLFDGKEDQLIY